MILIFTTCDDFITSSVIKRLEKLGCSEIMRVNADDTNSFKFRISRHRSILIFNNRCINLDEIKVVWYRKRTEQFKNTTIDVEISNQKVLTESLNSHLLRQNNKLSQHIHLLFNKDIRILGSASAISFNKLEIFDFAKQVGLCFDSERLLSSTSTLTKTQTTTRDWTYHPGRIENVTAIGNQWEVSDLPFNINHRYQLKIYYLDGKCYTTAIYNQSNRNRKNSLHKISKHKPNEMVPYLLPEKLRKNINLLFDQLDLNAGLVEMLVDVNDNFYFLGIEQADNLESKTFGCNHLLGNKVAHWMMDI